MADKKISQLSSASTPLAGTEALPIVQSNTTVKVATNDLTVKNVRSNATTGILQIAGPAAAATRTMTVPDANFTAARTDAANSFIGDQTLSTDNLIVGTAGKGIDFSANTAAPGATSELLNWYEEGTLTPTVEATSGAITSYTATGRYTRIGRFVLLEARIFISDNGTGSGGLLVGAFPFAAPGTRSMGGATREDSNTGNGLVFSGFTTTSVYVSKYDNSYPVGTGDTFTLDITYSV